MAMTGAGLSAARIAAKAAVALPANTAAAAAEYATALQLADSTAIVTYIQQNLAVTSQGADPQGGTVTSNSTAVT